MKGNLKNLPSDKVSVVQKSKLVKATMEIKMHDENVTRTKLVRTRNISRTKLMR